MIKTNGIQAKLVKLFLIQLVVISVVTLVGVYAAAKVVEEVLMREALEGESEHYWALYDQDKSFPLPNTENLLGYMASDGDFSSLPPELRGKRPGYGRVKIGDSNPIVHVSDRDNRRLYLIFDETQVRDLAFYFGIAPLSAVLVILYLLAWLSYRMSRKAVSPIIKLAQALEHFDLKSGKLVELDLSQAKVSADSDALLLIEALEHFTERLAAFIERERNFTRDASHELRTPLAVIKGSLDLLERGDIDEVKTQKALTRVRNTAVDMETLIETLLMLAREEESRLPEDPIILNDLVHLVFNKIRVTTEKPKVQLVLEERSLIEMNAPEKVVAIVLTNLIRNAFNYTEQGEIKVVLEENTLILSDTGIGMDESQLANIFDTFYRAPGNVQDGHGLGLAIVKRLCRQYGWPIRVSSTPGEGSSFTIEFPSAKQVQRSVAPAYSS